MEEAKADLKLTRTVLHLFLAKELGTTVAQLSQSLTHEELIGWAAFFELKGEQEEQAASRARMGRGMTRG